MKKSINFRGVLSAILSAAILSSALSPAFSAGIVSSSPIEKLFLQNGTGAVTQTYAEKVKESVSVKDYGIAGDDTDETVKLKNALVAGAGKSIKFESGKIYRATSELVVPANTTLDLNGSTIKFVTSGAVKNLDLHSGVSVKNGVVKNAGVLFSGDGQYQSPIVIGDSASGVGYSNITLQNLSIESARPNGNGIAIIGNSFNVKVDGIIFPSSATLGRPILLHWAGTETVGPVTTHPHNISISNINIGTMTNNSPTEIAGVFVSASYNVDISNVYVESMAYGAAVKIYAGDWGYQYGTATEKVLGAASISVKNIYGKALTAGHVYMKNPLGGTLTVWPGSIKLENFNFVSTDGNNGESKGFRIEGANGVEVTDSRVVSFYQGIYIGANTSNFIIEKSKIETSTHQGFLADLATSSQNIRIEKNKFKGNNTSAAAGMADITAYHIDNLSIIDNQFESVLPSWVVRIGGGAEAVSNAKISKNYVTKSSAAGPTFSLGSGADLMMVTEFDGNILVTAPTNGIKGGQIVVPGMTLAKHSSLTNQRIASAAAAPAGSWAVGDIVFNDAPAASGFVGWVYTATGWKTFGAIAQ